MKQRLVKTLIKSGLASFSYVEKIGTPEKTVGALSLHSGVDYSSPFIVGKTALHELLPL